MEKNKKYDFGIIGVWYGLNFGSALTYFSLQSQLKKMGFSTLMIEKPGWSSDDIERQNTHTRRFANEHFQMSEPCSLAHLHELNNICNGFIVGSDQVWNYGISRGTGKTFYLDFVEDSKRKIAYAASFGHNIDFAPDSERLIISKLMKRFDAISVREDDGVRICRDIYHVDAVQVLDPVFLEDPDVFNLFSEKSTFNEKNNYILAYFLDSTIEKKALLLYMSKRLGLRPVIILDGFAKNAEINRKLLDMDDCIKENLEVYDWLYFFKNASYVITDSFHGMCISLLFNKQFLPLPNKRRGYSRFRSITDLFGITNRLVVDHVKEIKEEKFMIPINYNSINNMIKKERKRCIQWLENAIKGKIANKNIENIVNVKIDTFKHNNNNLESIKNANEIDKKNNSLQIDVEKLYKNSDFIKIRYLITLLKDYGIHHIVLSPGGRDVPIVRMFEYNEKYFNLHMVTDERSAAYFGMGIASQLKKPVVCVCTSGTAASNYLPAVTEAYYTGIPLILVTADRYDIYHEQGEDQTIPQKNIYNGVTKKSISLPEGSGRMVEYQIRRDIQDCILETVHNGFGPVHINIGIENVNIGSKVGKEYWTLLPKIYPHILRVSPSDGDEQMRKWLNSLKRSKKILVVYGQNYIPSKKQKENIELFASKFNCVIVTDLISNLSSSYCVSPYNMLKSISNQEFDEKLSPDIVISVGGKRLMNDPLTNKIRQGKSNIRHWSVTPNGKVKDFYFHLTSILEMSQDYFFAWFGKNAGDIVNDGIYFQLWKELNEKYEAPVPVKFDSHYIQSKFIPNIPDGSILHLGVGLSFYETRRYKLNNNIEVFCNMGTNGIDGCTSTFLGQCAVAQNKLCFLIVGDLSFFYDMNSIWNKKLNNNMRILMVNNNGSGLLRGNKLKYITSQHNTKAEGWVKSTDFKYIFANSQEEFDQLLPYFLDKNTNEPLFFEVFCQ